MTRSQKLVIILKTFCKYFLKTNNNFVINFTETSIKGGEVSATAQGTKNGGTAQTSVSGKHLKLKNIISYK